MCCKQLKLSSLQECRMRLKFERDVFETPGWVLFLQTRALSFLFR